VRHALQHHPDDDLLIMCDLDAVPPYPPGPRLAKSSFYIWVVESRPGLYENRSRYRPKRVRHASDYYRECVTCTDWRV